MAIYRQIQTAFWLDSFILELTPEEKFFYIYLMTNLKTTQCGIFELHKRIMETETGYNRETIDKLLKRFIDYGKILYCEKTREVMIVNWIKYNFINSRNTILCINREIKTIKHKEFVAMFYELCKESGYPLETIFNGITFTPYEGASKDLGEEEIKEEYKKERDERERKEMDNVIQEFESKIHKAEEKDIGRLEAWGKDFEAYVILEAIFKAVKYKGKHMGYIDSVLQNWLKLGITTREKLDDYKKSEAVHRKKYSSKRANSDAYKYID